MRQKDFDEVATLLGNELRTCDPTTGEADGVDAAMMSLLGHASHRYPDLDLERIRARYDHASIYGWDDTVPPAALPEVQVSATGACLCTSFKWNTWNGQCSACGHEAHGSRIHCGALA